MTALTIQGYTLHDIDGEPMIEDLVLADRLGYDQRHSIRKLISRLLESGAINSGQLSSTVEKSQGRPGLKYFLSQKAALKVITRSETEKADQITDEMIDVFIEYRKGQQQQPAPAVLETPKTIKSVETEAMLKCFFNSALLMNIDPPMAKAIALEEVRSNGGFDMTHMLGHITVDEQPLVPRDLGKLVSMGAVKINKALAEAGYQEKTDRGWEITEAGKQFATMTPYKSRSSDHTGYQIKWYPKVLKALGLHVPAQLEI